MLVTLLVPPQACLAFSLERMCETRCLYGRGGNLCNCNAFHFAGKRDGGGPLNTLTELASDPFGARKYRDSGRQDGGASGVSGVFLSEDGRLGGGDGGVGVDDDDDGADVVVEGFFGVEGHRRAAVQRMTALLKAALGGR